MESYILFSVVLLVLSSVVTATDKVALQWAICSPTPADILYMLGEDDKPPFKCSPITYFDLICPVYTEQGFMFRKKFNKGKQISSVKLRFKNEPSNVPDSVDCRWDRYGYQTFYTCEKRAPVNGTRVWSDEQAQFLEYYRSIDWEDLIAFGPYWNAKWKVEIEGHRAVFDNVVAHSFHLMEIEMKVLKDQSESTYEMATKYLKEVGIVLCDEQEPRTLRLLRALGYPVNGDGSQSASGVQTIAGRMKQAQWPLQTTSEVRQRVSRMKSGNTECLK